jgi:RimJ/RimL family protein N-acetyltransferase
MTTQVSQKISMEIKTERFILREFIDSDWQAVLAYQSDSRYQRYYPEEDRTPESTQAFVQMFLDHQQEQPRTKFQLAVTLKSNLRLIGNSGIRMDAPDARQADIGYEFSPDHWGRGYATEAARAMVHLGLPTWISTGSGHGASRITSVRRGCLKNWG